MVDDWMTLVLHLYYYYYYYYYEKSSSLELMQRTAGKGRLGSLQISLPRFDPHGGACLIQRREAVDAVQIHVVRPLDRPVGPQHTS